ncbi:nucleotide disphospho-sugar-binding domain-containing protein [Kitasatospora aureofaciens]|uniref:glycosyltransferase n=1 Tax=Kitasatospora aureofaciens TaxID=1894 RepID=UPI0022773926|nr:nucleotide disphospho-sugar-binding domain-containing protein [Kitasatospora aureofaciens]
MRTRATPAPTVRASPSPVSRTLIPPLSPAPGSSRRPVAATIPQQELLPHAAAMVHHGGNNSFTECLHAGVPALVLPFSSDQFAIAHDAERAAAGRCLDPNTLTPAAAGHAVAALLADRAHGTAALGVRLRPHGPARAASALLRCMPSRR